MSELIRVEIKDEAFKKRISGLLSRVKNKGPLMKEIAGIMGGEVADNFEAEGRPVKWKQSIRAEKTGGQTLKQSGMLSKVTEDSDDNQAVVGSNMAYAAAQHYGVAKTVSIRAHTRKVKSRDVHADKTTKAGKITKGRKIATGLGVVGSHSRKMKIEARPFLVITPGGMAKIVQAAERYIDKE